MTAKPKNLRNSNDISIPENTPLYSIFNVSMLDTKLMINILVLTHIYKDVMNYRILITIFYLHAYLSNASTNLKVLQHSIVQITLDNYHFHYNTNEISNS